MLKIDNPMGVSEVDLETRAEQQMRDLLSQLQLPIENQAFEKSAVDRRADFVIQLGVGDQSWVLVCEVKSNGQPRNIRMAALQAKEYAQHLNSAGRNYAVVIAPFISADSGEICKELGVGYADLAGNCRLAFGTVYIEKSVAKNPFRVKREQRSLFAPKSARVLRVMFADPLREWKVAELAERAGVSYGLVSNVRKGLLDREWGAGNWGGVRLAMPIALLDAWKHAYKPQRSARNRYYTILHGDQLQNAIRKVQASMNLANTLAASGAHALLSSYSAARWIAPFARISGEYFYANAFGEELLKKHLILEPASKGENVTIDLVKDEGVFLEALEPKEGLRCTGLVQTYLDLAASGERGSEAADFLREQKIDPIFRGLK